MSSLLETIAFRQPRRAQDEMAALESGLPPAFQNTIEALLASAADPDAAVHYLASLKQQKPDALDQLARSQSGLHNLIAVFSHSRFLSDEILQNPQWIEQLSDPDRVLSAEEYKRRLAAFLDRQPPGSVALSLALFRRQQILRILLGDVRGFCSLPETTEQLSNLADAILDVTYQRIRADLVARHGVPRYVDTQGQTHECGMSVIALGKLGGRELNYSSDIDLMFVYTSNGETDGQHRISNKEFYKKVAN